MNIFSTYKKSLTLFALSMIALTTFSQESVGLTLEEVISRYQYSN